MLCQILLDECVDVCFGDFLPVSHDVGAGEFVARARGVRDTDHGGVEDEVVRHEEGFKFRGGDLEALIFDEFLLDIALETWL